MRGEDREVYEERTGDLGNTPACAGKTGKYRYSA